MANSKKQFEMAVLRDRIRAAEEAMRWCRANGKSAGPASREAWAAIRKLRQLETCG